MQRAENIGDGIILYFYGDDGYTIMRIIKYI